MATKKEKKVSQHEQKKKEGREKAFWSEKGKERYGLHQARPKRSPFVKHEKRGPGGTRPGGGWGPLYPGLWKPDGNKYPSGTDRKIIRIGKKKRKKKGGFGKKKGMG